MIHLDWSEYRHFPYERELALREATAVLGCEARISSEGDVLVPTGDLSLTQKLTYFSRARKGNDCASTLQSRLESSGSGNSRRQSTRYSVHGLHEYRGKFNPQVCSALINVLGLSEGDRLLDPFCGSGTTLVEAAHRGIEALGTDLNPLAVFISNAKLGALKLSPADLRRTLQRLCAEARKVEAQEDAGVRLDYLSAWFEDEPLRQIEALRVCIEAEIADFRPFFLVIASNLLRDFSLQNPADLRIRRRVSANQTEHFVDAFMRSAEVAIDRLEAALAILGSVDPIGRALVCDNRFIDSAVPKVRFDGAITSPPYATALPYIDTQRLSLVWLGLLSPSEIRSVDGDLIGSREMAPAEKRRMLEALVSNSASLPDKEATFCATLHSALGPEDGFRRAAMPMLMYRYFNLMAQAFEGVARSMKPGARFALIVGHNHTQLGGRRFEIDTPAHLASLAAHRGWDVEEVTALQPYQRYGLHAANATKEESLIILERRSLPLGG
ncbi:TRM11 family SAM-dependent methyltransferase [Erythrobacter donghaensis]|uniref:TRM11 family SAM-dependent methyltransferase n=1 Tax=Erythrobacter donghaensis TaxID=267135 RepID=UPI000A3A4A31|nr:DNA methyltransferase [Erythrobacter donghaensis]